MAADGADGADGTLAAFQDAGIDHRALADQLQRGGANSFDTSRRSLLASIAAKHRRLAGDSS